MRFAKAPRAPRQPLTRQDDDVLTFTGTLWRVHRTSGPHVLGWNALRHWGPAANCRWDPHPEPQGDHEEQGVMYAATDLATAVVEVFQDTRRIDPTTGMPMATSWKPTRPLSLLNITGDWWLRNGAASALTAGPRSTCRNWARQIRSTWPQLDGLSSESVLTGRPAVTLWSPAAGTFPHLPAFAEYLSGDLLWDRLDRIARRYANAGYRQI